MASTLLTAAILLGAVLIVIILFAVIHKNGYNKKLAKQSVVFTDIAWKNKLEISEQETINDYLLAIDKLNFVLLYIDFSSPKEEVVIIDLSQIGTIKVSTEDNSVYEQRKGRSVLIGKQVSKLQLEVPLINMQPNQNLILFDYKEGVQDLVYIKSRAEHWKEIINKCVKELSATS